jgi:hypothetical protein
MGLREAMRQDSNQIVRIRPLQQIRQNRDKQIGELAIENRSIVSEAGSHELCAFVDIQEIPLQRLVI